MAKQAKPGTKSPPDDDPPDEDDDGEAFTPRQMSQLSEMINRGANAAVNTQLGRKLDAAIDTRIGPRFDELKDLLGGAKPPKPGEGGDGGGKSKSEDPEIVEMRKREAARDQKIAAMENERKQERRNARIAERDRKLIEIATTAGVEKNRVRGVVALLGSSVKIDDESGAMTVAVKRDGFEDEVSLEEHASEFFKTDEGKSYLAPPQPNRGPVRQPGGGGAPVRQPGGGGSNAPARGKDAQKEQRVEEARQELQQGLAELVGGGSIGIG